MGNRIIERRIARALYDEFSRKWRRGCRLAGKSGVSGHRKPSFGEWRRMHLNDHGMMGESTPIDVQEFLGRDPWDESVSDPNEPKTDDIAIVPLIE